MGRPRAFDETEVLDAAAQLFWSHGYEGTSMSDLEKGLGLGRQSIYNAFGDKKALFIRALEHYAEQNRRNLRQTLSAPDAGLEEIRAHFRSLVDFSAADPARRGCLVANSIVEVGPEDEAVSGRCRANQATVLDGLEHALANAVTRGELSDVEDVSATARMLLVQTYGLTVLSKTGASAVEMSEAVRELLRRLR